MMILSEREVQVLELLNQKLLARLSEIKAEIQAEHDGISVAIQGLRSKNCIKVIEPIGEKCFVITHKGLRSLSEVKNPERRTGSSLKKNITFGDLASNV